MILWVANLGFGASGQTGIDALRKLITITGDPRQNAVQEG